MTKLVQIKEQLLENTYLRCVEKDTIIQYLNDGCEVIFNVRRGRKEEERCLKLSRRGENILATGSYLVGLDWVKEGKLAVQVCPKMNDQFEIDYIRMLNEALEESENFDHLKDLVTIYFEKPPIRINQQYDLLSIFLITEYLNLLQRLVRKGLKSSFYLIEENLNNKIKGRIQVSRTIHKNVSRGNMTDNVCRYQVYGVDSAENRILKKALIFCKRRLETLRRTFDTTFCEQKIRHIQPYFSQVGDDINVREIKAFCGNPVFKEYYKAVEFAQLLLKRFSYNITNVIGVEVESPPFWIDMSKLFELYVFRRLKAVFTGRGEITYHFKAHYQELDYLLRAFNWPEPYVIDAKYKPYYKNNGGITMDDARQVCGYARLTTVYRTLKLDENVDPPIKCLVVYPDQEQEEDFSFTRMVEPEFDKVNGYVRLYKVGIRLPVIKNGIYGFVK